MILILMLIYGKQKVILWPNKIIGSEYVNKEKSRITPFKNFQDKFSLKAKNVQLKTAQALASRILISKSWK